MAIQTKVSVISYLFLEAPLNFIFGLGVAFFSSNSHVMCRS